MYAFTEWTFELPVEILNESSPRRNCHRYHGKGYKPGTYQAVPLMSEAGFPFPVLSPAGFLVNTGSAA